MQQGPHSEMWVHVGTPTCLGGRQQVITCIWDRNHPSSPGIQFSWSLKKHKKKHKKTKTRSGHIKSATLLLEMKPVCRLSAVAAWQFWVCFKHFIHWLLPSEWVSCTTPIVTHLRCCVEGGTVYLKKTRRALPPPPIQVRGTTYLPGRPTICSCFDDSFQTSTCRERTGKYTHLRHKLCYLW